MRSDHTALNFIVRALSARTALDPKRWPAAGFMDTEISGAMAEFTCCRVLYVRPHARSHS